MRDMSYANIAFRVLSPFTTPAIDDEALRRLIKDAYSTFDDPAVAPLKQLDDRLWVLELFHGPTLAFKDMALQLLGRVLEHFIMKSGEPTTVIGATSGDTGSAAMAALSNRRNIEVFILYPQKGPSELQRRQMTCVTAPNVHALAIEGSFDECQAIVKTLFNDVHLRARHNFVAVNSINMFRILAQIVYYVVAAARTGRPVSFSVPTGNFGNIYAAYAALKCGLPIQKLAVASNKNDVLTRFFTSGRMQAASVAATLSPSMDIQISSNFERFLFDLCQGDGKQVKQLMEEAGARGAFSVSQMQLAMARQIFTAASADDELTLATIRDVHKDYGYTLDPHSAVGFAVAKKLARELPEPVIVLATAHPAKFPETIKRALGTAPPLPAALLALKDKPERLTLLPPRVEAVADFIAEKRAA
jgi:threonine synthase